MFTPFKTGDTRVCLLKNSFLAPVSVSMLLSYMTRSLTAFFTREGDGFVALCPELDVASQGDSVEDAKKNLTEAVELFFECASPTEVSQRLSSESFISTLEVQVA